MRINFELLPALERRAVEPRLLGQTVIDYLNGMPMAKMAQDREINYVRDG